MEITATGYLGLISHSMEAVGASLMSSYGIALLIGVAQGIAIWPGISRSGSTIGAVAGYALADRGAARMTSLDNAARLIGLPGKMGVDGSQVEGLHRAGRLEEIRHYCLTDVIQTAFVLPMACVVAVLLVLELRIPAWVRFGLALVAAVIGFVAMLCVGLALFAIWLFGYPFGFMGIVGTMGLVGLAINDSIAVLASLRKNPDVAAGDLDGVVATERIDHHAIVAESQGLQAGLDVRGLVPCDHHRADRGVHPAASASSILSTSAATRFPRASSRRPRPATSSSTSRRAMA